jgi:hypothetical protein
MGAKEARACHGSGGLRNFVTITDPVRNFSHAVELIQTGSYDAQGQLTNELLQLLIKLCQWRHMHSVQVRACNRSAALHRGRFAPMCSANHRQLKMRPHRLTIRLLVYVNYRDRVLFRDRCVSQVKRAFGIVAKPMGLNTWANECLGLGSPSVTQ